MTTTSRYNHGLGGRIPLLDFEYLSDEQRALHRRISTTNVTSARSVGYRADLDDGHLIGPFNGFLRVPAVAGPLLDAVDAVSAAGLPFDVREVVILTVVAELETDFPVYAHEIAARTAGVDQQAIAAITARRTPAGLSPDQQVAYRLVVALIRDHDVPDALYEDAVNAFGVGGTLTYVLLAGQYMAIGALTTLLRVPTPVGTQT